MLQPLKSLVALPWGYDGPTKCVDEGQESWVLRIKELPGFLVAGFSAKEVLDELPEALESFLASYVETGEVPPLPANMGHWRMGLFQADPAPVNRPVQGNPYEQTSGHVPDTRFAAA